MLQLDEILWGIGLVSSLILLWALRKRRSKTVETTSDDAVGSLGDET